jgi:hypothetical protein
MAAARVEESWKDGDGGMANGRKWRSSLSPNIATGLWLFFTFTQQKQSLYTVHIHAALGGGGLSMLLSPHLKWQDASGESLGRPQWLWRNTDGWQRQCGGGGLCTVLDSKFCICIFARIGFSYSYLAFLYIGPFTHQIIVKIVIFM